MQRVKRGNPCRRSRKRQRVARTASRPSRRLRLSLHERDPITGNEDSLYSLFYEHYRGYTIYSTRDGRCCVHDRQGCIKLQGKFACLPDVEETKMLIRYFRVEGYTSADSVERSLLESAYLWVNRTTPRVS